MFSFLKFFNSKSDADKNKVSDSLSGRSINLNSPEAKTLNIFNCKSPIARKHNGNNYSFGSNCKETVTSPGFSFRVAQTAREIRSTTSNKDTSNLSSSYTLENSLNSSNTINSNNASRDVYDKKRKLMESLDNFGVRKRTRQEGGVDAFVNRRRRTISESNVPDRITVINGYSHRLGQPISTVINSKSINVENKKIKRHGDFGANLCHMQKKPRTRNNEILSSYSSSKFLLKPGQKRPYQTDFEDKSPERKHCKSCTCCGSTILLEPEHNNHNKSDKTTETDLSDDLVTVAASRIFNRSGKTQVVKKMCMKNILNEIFDDVDPTPYTSIEKVEEKKKNAQKKVILNNQNTGQSNIKNVHADSDACPSSVITSKCNRVQPAETGTLFVPLTTVSVSNTITTPQTCYVRPSDSALKVIEENKSTSSVHLNNDSPIVSAAPSTETNQKPTYEVDGKSSSNQTPISTKSSLEFQTLQSTEVNSNEQHQLLDHSLETNKNDVSDKCQTGEQNNSKNDKNTPLFQFNVPASKSCEPVTNSVTVSSPSTTSENKSPIIQFGSQVDDSSKSPTFTFGALKPNTKQSTPVMQFGGPKLDDKQSSPMIQFGVPKVDDKQLTPTIQFSAPKIDDKQSTPVLQFGAPKVDNKVSTPVMQFGAPKSDTQQSISSLQFGAIKESESSTSSPLFKFGDNAKSNESIKPTETVKFQFGSPKSDNTLSSESKNIGFGSNNTPNQNLFNFGKADPPKYDTTVEKSPPKLQFGVLPAPVFGTSNSDQTKSQFSTSVVSQPVDNQGPKLVFGSQNADNKPATSAPGMIFGNNTANTMFQFNSSTSKLNDKTTEAPNSSFIFSPNKPTPTFGGPASQDKPTFQFNAQKIDEPKTQFATSVFGSQTPTTGPFKFGANDKLSTFGSTFPTSNQPLQFTNNTDKPAEPFKFGSTVPSSNAFQFNANKTENESVKFGQVTNTFSTSGFSGFGHPTSQQTTTFGNVPSPQPSPFGNVASSSTAPTFGTIASPSPITFGTNQGFQFGSTNNPPASNTSSTFNFGSNSQPTKPNGAFNFNAAPTTQLPFKFGQTPAAVPTPQFGGTHSQGAFGFGSAPMVGNAMPGSSQPLFSMGTAPAGERRKAKAVRRRQ